MIFIFSILCTKYMEISYIIEDRNLNRLQPTNISFLLLCLKIFLMLTNYIDSNDLKIYILNTLCIFYYLVIIIDFFQN